MKPPFSLPKPDKKLAEWEQFELKVGNIFRYALDCEVSKTRIQGFEIDCFAVSDKCFYVIECKTKSEDSGTYLKDYIVQFAGKINSVSSQLQDEDKTKKIVFILAASGFEIDEKNKSLAKTNKVSLWDDTIIKNIENLFSTIGPRAGQYINNYLDIEEFTEYSKDFDRLRIPALAYESIINGKHRGIYNLFLSAEHLLDLGYVYHISSGDPEAYQRVIKRSRLNGIANFINEGNTFNSSIVVVLSPEAEFKGLGEEKGYEYQTGFLFIPRLKSSVKIIDGQHRLYAYEWADETHKKDKIPVLALSGLDASEQAKIFLDINDHQTPVPRNDLNLIMSRIDPLGTGFLPNVILAANTKGALENVFETPLDSIKKKDLKLANAVKGLSDRKLFSYKNPLINRPLDKIDQRVIEECADILNHFYARVIELAERVHTKWVNDFILTNNGFNIFLYVLAEVGDYYHEYRKGWIQNTDWSKGIEDFFKDNLERIDEIRQMSSEGGRRENAKALIYEINKNDKSFGAKFIKGYEPREERSVKTTGEYLEQVSEIENLLKGLLAEVLSRKNGPNWWIISVPDRIKERVQISMENEKKSYLEGNRAYTREKYLTFGDIEIILERQYKYFRSYLHDKNDALYSISAIRHVRNKLSHGQKIDDLSDDEKIQFERSYKQLKKRLSRY